MYEKAQLRQAIEDKRIARTLVQLKACLTEGFPFVFGFAVYDSFHDTETSELGKPHLPIPGNRFLGGYSVLAVGYSEKDRVFICINSWGKDWGNNDCITMTYEYLLNQNLWDVFWSIRLVEDA